MIIENHEEKGLYQHQLNINGVIEDNIGFYITKDLQFFVKPSIWSIGKWSIVPSTPESAMKVKLERFEGKEEDVLNKLKEWS
jgi:hypothetical protein